MASITQYKEFQAPALLGFRDAVLETDYDRLAIVENFIGDETVYSTNFAYQVIKSTQHIAAMIGNGAEKPVVDRDATAKVMGELARYGLKDVITVEELLQLAQPRNEQERNSVVDALLVRSERLLNALRLRQRVEKMKALALGYNDYNNNGVKVRVEYTLPDEHKVALAGAEKWTADKDILGDLIAWNDTYVASNGFAPEAMLVSRQVQNALTANKGLIAEAGRQDGITRISVDEVNAVLQRHGLPVITLVNETEITVHDIYTGKDVKETVFPQNRVVFASTSEKAGKFLTGPNEDSEDFAPEIVLAAYDERTPRRSIFEASVAGLAIVDKPSLLFHADVL